jgi:hypothetical protein
MASLLKPCRHWFALFAGFAVKLPSGASHGSISSPFVSGQKANHNRGYSSRLLFSFWLAYVIILV